MISEKMWETGLNQTQALVLNLPFNSQLQSIHKCMSKTKQKKKHVCYQMVLRLVNYSLPSNS